VHLEAWKDGGGYHQWQRQYGVLELAEGELASGVASVAFGTASGHSRRHDSGSVSALPATRHGHSLFVSAALKPIAMVCLAMPLRSRIP
jgi:hypothetical protein